MENMIIYEKVREVPDEAQKKITGGRLKGMTDIRPMWRIEKLTEVFGPVGIGWYTKTINKEILEGANGEKKAIVDILLFVNYKNIYNLEEDMWSIGIEGTGGSDFVSREKAGYYTNDECYKMAYTDALSVACKALGFGANIYWGDSKYDTLENIENLEQAKEIVIDFGKKYKNKKLVDVFEKDRSYIDWLLENSKDKKILQAISILKENEKNEVSKADLLAEIRKLEIETNTEHDDILEYFKVESETELNIEQIKECLVILNKKFKKEVTPYDF